MADERNKPAFITGEQVISNTNVPEQLPDQPIPDGYFLVVKTKADNVERLNIGNSAVVQEWSMGANDWVRLKVVNLNEVWIIGTKNDGIEYISEV